MDCEICHGTRWKSVVVDGVERMFFIGDETGPVRLRSSGRLYLGVNDDVLTDNSGNFRVVVYY